MKKILIIATIIVVAMALIKGFSQPPPPKVTHTHTLTLEEAKAKVGDDGYILFAYADGWDTYSHKVINKLINNKDIRKAAGNAIFLRYPIRQALSKDEQKIREEQWKGMKIPNADNYPALLLYDKNGKHYSTICGTFMRKAQPRKVSKMIAERLAAKHKQDELMAQAEKAQGIEKARLIGQACLMENINRPDQYEKLMKAADKEDKSGMIRRVTFNPWVFIESKLKEDPKAVLAQLDTMLADSAYSDEQKQVLCTCAIGTLHRLGGSDMAARIREYAKRLKQYGPDTVLGKSADIAVREWALTLNYTEGWQPSVLPEDQTPIELEGKLPINKAGIYTVSFNYQKGRHAVRVKAVELYDGDTKVAEDRHDGSAGLKISKNTYDLNVEKDVKEPRLFITFDMGKNRDSYGKVTIIRQK